MGDYKKSCDWEDCCWEPQENSLKCMCHVPKEDGTPDGSEKYYAYLDTGKCTKQALTWQVFNTKGEDGKPKLDCKPLHLIDDRSQYVPGM